MDYSGDFDLAGLLAKWFGGALPFSALEKMTRREMMHYYRIYEKQAIEEEEAAEYQRKHGRRATPQELRRIVDKRIAAIREREKRAKEERRG